MSELVSASNFAREWIFRRKIDLIVPDDVVEVTDGPIEDMVRRVKLKSDRTVDLGNGEEGIWNFKEGKHAYLEMEFDLDEDERSYLLYRIGLKRGRFNKDSAVVSPKGTIELVKGLPFPWNKEVVGSFEMEMVLPKPIIDGR